MIGKFEAKNRQLIITLEQEEVEALYLNLRDACMDELNDEETYSTIHEFQLETIGNGYIELLKQ